MALTYKESTLVRASIPILREHGETVSTLCYSNLLRAHPELTNLFNPANQASGRQPRAFTAVILAFAANVNHMAELVPRFERMCNRHCSLGIRPEHYDVVGRHLLQAFGQVLGPACWTPELRAAWAKAYAALASVLINREKQMYGGFGGWEGWRAFKVARKSLEAGRVYSLYLAPVDGQPLPPYWPGQYVSLRVKAPSTGRYQLRQYSLSDASSPDHYRLTIKRLQGDKMSLPGVVSCLLDDARVGDTVELSHPAGEFSLDPESSSSPVVLISAGVGVTPNMAILQHIASTRQSRPVAWIHSSPGQAPFEEHVRRLAQANPNIHATFFRSQASKVDDHDDIFISQPPRNYEVGRLDLAKVGLEHLHLDHGSTEYFICGPEALMEDMTRFLSIQGVETGRIKCERFSTGDLEFKTYGLK